MLAQRHSVAHRSIDASDKSLLCHVRHDCLEIMKLLFAPLDL